MNTAQKIVIGLAILLLIGLIVLFNFGGDGSENNISPEQAAEQQKNQNMENQNNGSNGKNEQTEPESAREVVPPIARHNERISKKPFGLYVNPQNSPVSPERFSGFHAGVDFEVFPQEAEVDVPINAVCDGELASKRSAQGYGGVVTQYCIIGGQAVTIIYGHMRLTSINVQVGDQLKAGDKIGVLGTGFSAETDNERKHLHLGIVKGRGSDIRGYVAQQSLLSNFLDITKLF